MANTYDIGDEIRLTGVFTVSGVATDPTVVRCKVRAPGGAVTTSLYGTDAALVKDATGTYHLDLTLTLTGTYYYRWEGTGAAQAAEETAFNVRPSVFP